MYSRVLYRGVTVGGQGSVVGVATRLRAGRFGDRMSVGARDFVGRGSVVVVATRYGMDGPEIECRWG
jgi:hypothetical protein